jgi:hypothetical protein
MHAFTNLAPRQSEPIVSVAPRNRRRRRLYFHLRNFGRAAAPGMIGIWTGLLKALHDSRSRLAVRVIDQHRHLLGLPTDERGSSRGHAGGARVRQTERGEE